MTSSKTISSMTRFSTSSGINSSVSSMTSSNSVNVLCIAWVCTAVRTVSSYSSTTDTSSIFVEPINAGADASCELISILPTRLPAPV